jgi:hypothetical protein
MKIGMGWNNELQVRSRKIMRRQMGKIDEGKNMEEMGRRGW